MNINILTAVTATTFLMGAFNIGHGQVNQKAIDANKKKWNVPTDAEHTVNPYEKIIAASDNGKVLYLKLCSVCHGSGGKGDGIAAAGLSVQPANHTSDMVQSQTDGAIFYELTTGHAPMPAYKTILTEKQRWELVDFIRTLKSKAHK